MRVVSYNNPKSPISEAYRSIRTNIEFSNFDEEVKTIVVTSSQQNEGKSTVTANLAVSFATLEDKKVLIMDGDLRNPTVHRMFGISNITGVTDILTGNKDFLECVHTSKVEGLHILTCGKIPPNPSEMLGSKKMKKFVEELKNHYDYIFIDAPPVGIITDAGIIASYVDGTVLVVGSKEADIEAVKISKERLDKVNANILGAVLNKYEAEGSSNAYYNYYYGHDEDQDKKKGKHSKKKSA
ncbi:CpsD/CapB family tyrosine-protein kinase [Romboutsia weinsteinii]|nr:CpsD/CapB family tyrosine-protein kinase [Romboutsia weinsteinii]